MSYWDAFTANIFGRNNDNCRTYTPFGKFGKTYLVPDERVIVIQASIRRAYQIMLTSTILTQILFGWKWNLIVGPVVLACFYINSFKLVKGLEIIPANQIIKTSRIGNMQRSAEATGVFALSLLLIVSLLFVFAGIWLVAQNGDLAGWLCLIFFGLCAFMFAFQLFLLRQNKGKI